MVISKNKSFRGRKQGFGSICFDEGKMQLFLGYHSCPDGVHKILIDIEEARQIARKVGIEKQPIKKRVAKRLITYLEQ